MMGQSLLDFQLGTSAPWGAAATQLAVQGKAKRLSTQMREDVGIQQSPIQE